MSTTQTPKTRASMRPPIQLAASDAERLSALALRCETGAPQVAELLFTELERARIRPDAALPADVVRPGSRVAFVDESHGGRRTVTLVYPAEADIAAGRISVLTPIGVGLLGLSPGQTILWPDREGARRTLRILSVSPPEAISPGSGAG